MSRSKNSIFCSRKARKERNQQNRLGLEVMENRLMMAGLWGDQVFTPYVNTLLDTNYDYVAAMKAAGAKHLALGFIDANAAKQPAWDGSEDFGSQADLNIRQQIRNVRAAGGDVMVSFGGQTEGSPVQELAIAITNVAQLQAAYQKVIDELDLKYIDFDIEGDKMLVKNPASIDRRSQAIAGLQAEAAAEGRELHVYYTLPTTAQGLEETALNVVDSALRNGVDLDVVNIMTMNYNDGIVYDGQGGRPTMGQVAINAVQGGDFRDGLFRQLKAELAEHGVAKTDAEVWSMIGITPMIGVNDGENGQDIFTLNDARTVLNFAQSHDIGQIGYWAIGRDQNPNNEGGVAEDHSGIRQNPYEFAKIFAPFEVSAASDHLGFLPAVSSSVEGAGPQLLASGSFNANTDAIVDLAVTNQDGSISILLGEGNGKFTLGIRFFVAGVAGPEGIVAGDFNKDGKQDLAVASNGNNDNPGAVTILTGNGDGTFTKSSSLNLNIAVNGQPLPNGVLPTYLATADMDGDANLDLVVADFSNPHVYVFKGQGDGTFQFHDTNFAANGMSNGEQVVVGDFNGDNLPDIAVANKGDGSVSLFKGVGGGSITAAGNFQLPTTGSIGLAGGDLDGDRKIDLAVANYGTDAVGAKRLSILRNTSANGGISFAAPTSVDLGDHLLNVVIADFNEDGKNDIAVSSSGNTVDPNAPADRSVWVLYNQGVAPGEIKFPVPAAALVSGANPVGLINADLNGDGHMDLISANQSSGNVSAFLNQFTAVDEPTVVLKIAKNAQGQVEVREAVSRNDNITVTRSGTNLVIALNPTDPGVISVAGIVGATGNNTKTVTIPLAIIEATGDPLAINTLAGNDLVYIGTNGRSGDVIPSTGLAVNLGTGVDTLDLIDNTTDNAWKLSGEKSGSVTLGQLGVLKFTGLEHALGGAGKDVFTLANLGANGILSVDGDGGAADAIKVARDANFVLTNTKLTVTPVAAGAKPQSLQIANVSAASLTGGASNNVLDARSFSGRATLNGGLGNDVLWGGSGSDILNGGDGNDWLGGGAGNDLLRGNAGRDVLVGGTGVDKLNDAAFAASHAGDDILIGGSTNFDTNRSAIDAILAAWGGTGTFQQRITTLKTTGVGANRAFKLNASSVRDDGQTDTLFGGSGSDWFFAQLGAGAGQENPDDSSAETALVFDI